MTNNAYNKLHNPEWVKTQAGEQHLLYRLLITLAPLPPPSRSHTIPLYMYYNTLIRCGYSLRSVQEKYVKYVEVSK